MKNLLIVVVLLLAGIASLGLYRGWFHLSTDSTEQKPSATVTLDPSKIHADEQEAKDKVQAFGHEAKEKFAGPSGKAKEVQPQP